MRKRGIEREGDGATKTKREEELDICQMQRVAEMGNIPNKKTRHYYMTITV